MNEVQEPFCVPYTKPQAKKDLAFFPPTNMKDFSPLFAVFGTKIWLFSL